MPSSEQTAPGPLWYKKITKKPAPRRSKMAIPDPPKAGSPFCALWTGGWNPKTPKINNFFIPEITLRGGYRAACAGSRGDRIFPAENSGKRARNGHFGLPSQDLVHCGCRKRYHIFLSSRGPAGVGRGRVPSDNRDDRRQRRARSETSADRSPPGG